MADLTLGEAVVELRNQIDDRVDVSDVADNPPSHISRLEPGIPVSGLIDGSNDRFRVAHYPVLTSGTIGDVIQVEDQAGNAFTVDVPGSDFLRGIIRLTLAPSNPPSQEIRITYFSKFFFDEQLRKFIRQGVKFCGVSQAPVADGDALGVGEGLHDAVLAFASYLAYKLLSTKTADFFNFSAGGKTEDKGEVPKNWADLAKTAYADAIKLRSDPYIRQGRRDAPATGFAAFPSAPYTPPR